MSKASGSIDLKSLKVAGDGATKYITEINPDGIFISPSNQSPTSTAAGNSIQIDGSGMNIYKNGISVAMYGTSVRIGSQSQYNISLDNNSLSINKNTASKIKMYVDNTEFENRILDFYPENSSRTSEIFGGVSNNYPLLELDARYSDSRYAAINIESRGDGSDGPTGSTNAHVTLYAGNGTVDTWMSVHPSYVDMQYISSIRVYGVSDDESPYLAYMQVAPTAKSQTYNASWYKTTNNNYQLCRPSSSSRKYKENIQLIGQGDLDPHRLYDLSVVQFKFKEDYFPADDIYNKNRYDMPGFIAEDVLKYYPRAAIVVDEEAENWDERYIIPPMLKLIQEQHEEIEQLKKQIQKIIN